MLGLRVDVVGVARAQLLEQRRRRVGQLSGLAVDQAQLDLDAEARAGDAWNGICMCPHTVAVLENRWPETRWYWSGRRGQAGAMTCVMVRRVRGEAGMVGVSPTH